MKNQIAISVFFFLITGMLWGQPQTLMGNFRERTAKLSGDVLLLNCLSELDQAGRFQLDSIVWGYYDQETDQFLEKKGKQEFTYDEYGYPESGSYYFLNEGIFRLGYRKLFDYDADGKIELFLWQDWNADSLKWENGSKQVYSYDEADNLMEILYYEVDPGKGLQLSDRIIFTYDVEGHLVNEVKQEFDAGEWYDNLEWRYTYDENGNKTSYSYWILFGGADSLETFRTEYTYDVNNRLFIKVDYGIDLNGWNVFPFKKDSFLYDSSNRLEVEFSFSNFSMIEVWKPQSKKEYYYDNSQTPYQIKWFIYENPDSLTFFVQEDILMDDKGNIISFTTSDVTTIDGTELIPRSKMEFERVDEIILDDLTSGSLFWVENIVFEEVDFHGFQVGQNSVNRYGTYSWDEVDEVWSNKSGLGEAIFYYSELNATSTEKTYPIPKILVYPNPVDRLLVVETDLMGGQFDLYLYNMFGQRVSRKNISGNEQVVLPELPEGVYMLQLFKGNELLGSRKVMIRH